MCSKPNSSKTSGELTLDHTNFPYELLSQLRKANSAHHVQFQGALRGWGCSLVAGGVPSMHKALSLISSTQ